MGRVSMPRRQHHVQHRDVVSSGLGLGKRIPYKQAQQVRCGRHEQTV